MNARKHNLDENTLMWFGIHKGKRLKDVPNEYFEYLLKNKISFRGIKNYTKTKINKHKENGTRKI